MTDTKSSATAGCLSGCRQSGGVVLVSDCCETFSHFSRQELVVLLPVAVVVLYFSPACSSLADCAAGAGV